MTRGSSILAGVAATLAATLALGACKPAPAAAPSGAGAASADREGGAADAPSRWSYTIGTSEDLSRLALGLCIEGPAPKRLRAGSEAVDFVTSARVRGGPSLARDGRQLVVESLGEHGCVDLEIDLDAALEAPGRDSVRRGETLMVAPDRWLWYPAKLPSELDARARFELPDGVHATVSWPELDAGWRALDRTSFGWNAWVALGRFTPLELEVGGCTFEIAVLDGARAASDAGIEAWIRTAAETSVQLFGRFPRERVAVVVIPYPGWGDDPVLFGMARRGGGGSAMLMLNESVEDPRLVGEWVASHELLHLGMPLVADPWMSEGFVTYYTQVLRARQGVLAGPESHDRQVERALEALHRGFRRARGTRTLGRSSEQMRRVHSYQHVYWGGAAIAFDLDVQLRAASGGRRSLDDLMLLIGEFAPLRRSWPYEELIELMDAEVRKWHAAGELSAAISVSGLVEGHLDAKTLPARVERLEGVAIELRGDDVQLRSHPAAELEVRRSMFEPLDVAEGGSNPGSG